MKKLIFGFLLGLVAGVGGYWYLSETANRAPEIINQAPGKLKAAIQDKIAEIRPEDIKEELSRTGIVIRQKAKKAGEMLADATADARITAAIKAKLLKEPGLSSFKIHVETSEGLVTMSGVVSSHEELAKAVRLALETEGVQKVISTLQVKPAGR